MRSGLAARKRRPGAEEGDAATKRTSGPGAGMVNFCPQCGQKVEEMFHFCPACGGRLPVQEEEPMQITPSPSLKGKTAFRSPKKERCPCVKPLPEREVLTDLNNKEWMICKLLSQSDRGLLYEAKLTSERSPKHKYTLKLDAKEGKLFNEQNFLQRAAKKVTVEKWKKQYLKPFLGIPECLGFGVHENSYRFLVFPELGRSLQSILDDNKNKMTEKALDVLEYLHENDPGGKHVSQRECSRTPHEGTLEFISLDSHRGAAPSRRSDLESLGYCLLKWLWGALPWSADLTDPCVVTEEKERCKADIIKNPRPSPGWGALPESIQKYLQQVMTLEYEEKPNYEELRMLFTRPLQLMRASAYDSVDLRLSEKLNKKRNEEQE
ncbi:hypothetical protein E2320_012052 [Naja naja]|nr:hypothetical protein E2320_012052 [Naja naja]